MENYGKRIGRSAHPITQGGIMHNQHQTISRDRWTRGAIVLAVSALLFAGSPYWQQQVVRIPYLHIVASLLLVAAFFLFARDAGAPRAMLSDRRMAWTSFTLLTLSVVGGFALSQSSAALPSVSLAALSYLFQAAGLVALGAFAWAVQRSPRIRPRYRRIIVAALVAMIISRVVEFVLTATPVLATADVMWIYQAISTISWITHAFGMLTIALAALLAVHNEQSVTDSGITEPVSADGMHDSMRM